MSVGPTGGVLGSAAGAPLSQSRGDAERNAVDGAGRDRQADDAQRAEKNSGVGQTEEDQGASDRDADGRRQWEAPAESGASEGDAPSSGVAPQPPAASKDATGAAGNQLDLMG